MKRLPALLVASVVLLACSPPTPETTGIATLPALDLSRFEPGLQRRLSATLAALPDGAVAKTGDNAQAWLAAGRLLQAHGIENLALICYRNSLLLQPDQTDAVYLAAYLELQDGNLDAAADGFETVAALDTNDVAALLRLGEIHLQRGETDAAGAAFRAVLQRREALPAASSGLGRTALARQEYAAARDHLVAALRAEPAADQLHYPLALAYRGLGETDQARVHLAKRGTRQAYIPDPRLERVRSLMTTSQTHIKAGLAAYESGDLATAAAQYRLALEQNPGLGDTHLALAWVLEGLGDDAGARRHAETALELVADPAMAHYQLGRLNERSGDDRAAAAAYGKALLTSDAAPPRELLAGALMRLGNFADAAEHYRQLLESAPETARLHYLQGLALLAGGDCRAAASALDRAKSLAPGSAEVAETWIRIHASCRRDQSRATVALAAELFSALPEASFAEAYAMALAADGQFDRAVQLQQRVAASLDSGFSAELLRRFRSGQAAVQAWPADAPVFAPPRLER